MTNQAFQTFSVHPFICTPASTSVKGEAQHTPFSQIQQPLLGHSDPLATFGLLRSKDLSKMRGGEPRCVSKRFLKHQHNRLGHDWCWMLLSPILCQHSESRKRLRPRNEKGPPSSKVVARSLSPHSSHAFLLLKENSCSFSCSKSLMRRRPCF